MTAYKTFRSIPTRKYGVIYADPPWHFATRSPKGDGRSPSQHYQTMSTDEIALLDVRRIAAEDCALIMWSTSPHLLQALELGRSWGFEFKSKAFAWSKTNPKRYDGRASASSTWFMGLGYGTRKNTEDAWLFTRGSPKVTDKGVRELVVAPRREHSRKPDEVPDRIERLFAGPYIELFARTERAGWDVFGNQIGKFDGH